LPSALGVTLYGRFGNWIVILLVALVAGSGFLTKPRGWKG
jgi:hypothetical protein